MKNKLPLVIAVFSLLFFSCASTQFESNFSPVYVTNTSKFALLPPSASKEKIDTLQQMSAKFKTNEFQTPVYVVSDENNLSMTILNEFGTTMASLFYDGLALDFDSTIFPKNIKIEYIVADLQFCLYDEKLLKDSLAKIGVDFEITVSSDSDGNTTETRILSKKGKKISTITKMYDDKKSLLSIDYENFLRGYSYNLQSLD